MFSRLFSRLYVPGALAAAVVLIGCGGSSTATAPPAVATATQPSGAAPTPTATVEASSGEGTDVPANIQNFTHQELAVQVGDTIVWTQQDQTTHTTTSGTPGNLDGIWNSGTLQQGQTFSVTLTEAGTFPYFCTIHPSMTANVTVTEGDSAMPGPTATPTPPPTVAATATATQVSQPTVNPTATATATATTTQASQPTATATATVATPQGATVQSGIQNFTLEDLTVRVGDTIVWTQLDSVTHTTTSGPPKVPDGVWDSEFLNNGQTFSFTFTEVGTFPYYCTLHSTPGSDFMTATVTVTEAGSADTTSSPPEATATSSGDSSGGGDIEY